VLARHASAAVVFVFEVGARICHQRPERSFHIAGVQMPVCARCLGLYVSGALGAAIAWVGRAQKTPALLDNRIRLMLALAALPTALSVAVEWIGLAHPSNVLRALLALSLGGSAGWAFVRSFRVSRGR
jgi:uncharacterized membrane protein